MVFGAKNDNNESMNRDVLIFTERGLQVGDRFLPLGEIIRNCLTSRVINNKLVLVTIEWKGHRGFDGLTEKFVLSRSQWQTLQSQIIGETIYFGEIAGKHSDIRGTIDEGDITVDDSVSGVVGFLQNNPTGREYDHSFIDRFYERVSVGCYDNNDNETNDAYWEFYQSLKFGGNE